MSLFFVKHPREADLALFAGGELGPLARWRIERHLGRCETCQEAVADFFHLQGDLSEIGELPEVDWQALAHQVKVAVAQGATQIDQRRTPAWFARPAAWKLGLASATVLCAVVVVRQLPLLETQPETAALQSQTKAPAARNEVGAETAAQEQFDLSFADKKTAPEQNKNTANEPAAQELDDISGGKAKEAAQVAQKADRQARAVPSEAYAVSPLGNRAEDEREVLRQARQPRYEIASEDEEAPRSTVAEAKGPRARSVAPLEEQRAFEDSVSQTAGEQRAAALASSNYRAETPADLRKAEADRDDAAGAGARLEEAESARVETETEPVVDARVRTGGDEGEVGRRLSQAAETKGSLSSHESAAAPGFSYLPAGFENAGAEIGVAADGWVSIRTLDSDTSTITITNVYVP